MLYHVALSKHSLLTHRHTEGMISKITSTLVKAATFDNVILIGVLWFAMSFFIMPEATRQNNLYLGGERISRSLFKHTPQDFHETIGLYGENGRKHYLAIELTADLFHDFVSSLFLCLLLIWTTKVSKNKSIKLRHLLWLFLMTLLTYFIENASIVWVLISYPQKILVASYSASFSSIINILLILFCCTLTLWNLVIYWKKNRQNTLSIQKNSNS